MNEHECDKHGDNKDGWPNCSICGETDWDSLFKKNFKAEEVLDLITQSEKIMDEMSDIEVEHFEKNFSNTGVHKLIHDTIMDAQDISEESVRDEPFDGFLGDRELLVSNLVKQLNKQNKLLLFIVSHDKIFGTSWLKTYDEWIMKNDPLSIRVIKLEKWKYKNE
jgi:hypothetical protein